MLYIAYVLFRQVELALDVESLLPSFFQRRFMRRCYKLKPNQKKTALARLMNFESSHMTSVAIAKALDPELVRVVYSLKHEYFVKSEQSKCSFDDVHSRCHALFPSLCCFTVGRIEI